MVNKKNLLMIASIVWMIAGFNVLKIGIESYATHLSLLNLLLSGVIFIVFWLMVFYKLTVKHTTRITNYQNEKQFFLNFFDGRSFIIMAVMIVGGLAIRAFHLLPETFIAVFYTGLGGSLLLAGLLFGVNFLKFRKVAA